MVVRRFTWTSHDTEFYLQLYPLLSSMFPLQPRLRIRHPLIKQNKIVVLATQRDFLYFFFYLLSFFLLSFLFFSFFTPFSLYSLNCIYFRTFAARLFFFLLFFRFSSEKSRNTRIRSYARFPIRRVATKTPSLLRSARNSHGLSIIDYHRSSMHSYYFNTFR